MGKADKTNPLVSVCMITYNHTLWIGQAIEGVLMQKTDFPFELVIGDDNSTDDTIEMIRQYASENQATIQIYHNDKNVGFSMNFAQTLNKCRGRYIAICDGDDYWTDPLKLKKQVDFLENNPEKIMCSHNCSRYYESENRISQNEKYSYSFKFDQRRFLEEWVTQPLTCMFRNFFYDYSLLNKEKDIFCDLVLFYELLKHGNGYFMPDNMAMYRVHHKALSSGLSRWGWLYNHVIMFDYLYKHNQIDSLLLRKSRDYCLTLFIYKLQNSRTINVDFKPLEEYFKRRPGFFEKGYALIVRVPFYILKYGLFYWLKTRISSER